MEGKKWVIIFCLVLTFNGCQSTQITDNKYSNLQGFYMVTLPGEPWKRIKADGNLVMQNQESNANFAIITHPLSTNKVTLDVLYKQLFIGIKGRGILKKHYVNIDNHKVLHLLLEAELDNLDLRISAYIIQIKDVVCDIVYWSTPDKFDMSLEDFDRVVNSFKFTGD